MTWAKIAWIGLMTILFSGTYVAGMVLLWKIDKPGFWMFMAMSGILAYILVAMVWYI